MLELTLTVLIAGFFCSCFSINQAQAAQLMQVCAANGLAEADHSALVKALELMANHEVAKG